MRLIRKPTRFAYWSTSDSQQTPWYGKVMPRMRFQLVLKIVHLTRANLLRADQKGNDACGRFQPIIDQFNTPYRYHFNPRQKLSIDETFIGAKNRPQLFPYLPNKHHHKWGIKL
ncbi:PiggyBac transposase uribo2 [Plakobranchus ocellatus]|uniref:PiggyBac transposase uribo2 n=1 Tax=Plakobranchus ocellatus TaxID=259542 RepID=A0AAV4ADI4_9GAST|nr:PiggyBac transposase uribo2 [Plakobranchus ocellatus]